MLAEQPPRAVVQPREMPVQIAASAPGDPQRGKYPECGPRPRRRRRRFLAERGAEGADQRGGLEQALAVLRVRIGVRGDTAAAAEPDPVVMELEGADGDVELEPGDRAAVSDRAGVDLPGRCLQLTDDLQGADLRGAGDRSRRERRADQL